jgi:hypothetical protein
MRSGRAAAMVGAALMSVCAFTGTAAAATVSGSVDDEQDATPEVLWNGQVRDNPDLKRLSVTYESTTGTINAGVELWRALAYDGNAQYGTLYVTLGSRFDSAGRCVADTSGDPTVFVQFYRSYSPYDYVQASAQFVGFNGTVGGAQSPAPADWSRLSASVAADPSKNRSYKCARDVRLESSGTDEARPFCLSGSPCPTDTPGPIERDPPTVRWVSPRDGQVVSGIYAEKTRGRQGWHGCLVEARDSSGIDRTENLVDGQFHDRQIDAPYACEWDTREVSDGRHTLTAVAYDRWNNSARSTITVTVRNSGAAPPTPGTPPPGSPAPSGAPPTPSPSGTAPSGSPPPTIATPGPGAALRGRIVAGRTLRGFALDGMRVRVECPGRSRASVRVVISRRAARRLGLPRTLARGSHRLDSAGAAVVRVRPSLRVARRLLKVRRLDASLRIRASGGDEVELQLRRGVTLRR